MAVIPWELEVYSTKLLNRARYLIAAPRVYRNWWAWPLPKIGVGIVLETRGGIRFLARPHTADLATLNEAFILRPYLRSELVALHSDSVVVDVGAHIGDFSLEAASLCRNGRVYAVEPVAEFSKMIQINRLLNEFENIEIVTAALGAFEGVVRINLAGSSSSLHWESGDSFQEARQTTLARLMSDYRIDHIDLLKMDCEGSEWDVLPNSRKILPKVSQICMEYHPRDGWTGERLAAFLRAEGYTVEYTQGGWNGSLWATRMPINESALPRSAAGR